MIGLPGTFSTPRVEEIRPSAWFSVRCSASLKGWRLDPCTDADRPQASPGRAPAAAALASKPRALTTSAHRLTSLAPSDFKYLNRKGAAKRRGAVSQRPSIKPAV